MSLTLQVLLSGIAAGAVYGVVAIGHTVVFRLTGIVHLAFGDLIGVGVFTSLGIAVGTGPATPSTIGQQPQATAGGRLRARGLARARRRSMRGTLHGNDWLIGCDLPIAIASAQL